jgi:hypothetical protein
MRNEKNMELFNKIYVNKLKNIKSCVIIMLHCILHTKQCNLNGKYNAKNVT